MVHQSPWNIQKCRGFAHGPGEKCSYFVERSFGNSLLFSHLLPPHHGHQHFWRSRGGIFRQFAPPSIALTAQQVELFHQFGAALVIKATSEADLPRHPEVPFEREGKEFFDHQLQQLAAPGQLCCWLKGRREKVLFLGDHLFLDRGSLRWIGEEQKEAWQKELASLSPDRLVATWFRGPNEIYTSDQDWQERLKAATTWPALEWR